MDSKIFDCFATSERATKAIGRIQAKKYDTDSWNILIKEAANKNIDDVEPFYEELITIFPTSGRFWRTYIEHEMRLRRYEKVSKLFQRSLEEVLSIDLYKCYLNYVREAKSSEPDLIYKAFRYTLDKVGIDPNAMSIYNDYIQFIKDREVDGSYLDSQKIMAVRKAYQEGVLVPMFHVESLWKEYISWEQNISANIAEKMVQDRSRDHMNARRAAKEWEAVIRGLNRSWAAIPPSFQSEELRQLDIWRRYLQWEKSNPLRSELNAVITKRVTYAYKQFLLSFGHHPNVYYEYGSYLDEQIKYLSDKEVDLGKRLLKEQAILFERATKGLMKNNLLVHFAYADFEEARNDKRKAIEIYNNLIELGHKDEQIDLTLVYIQFMRFTRRTDGLKAARAVFKRARDDKRCNHQVYTAAAMMEHHCTKDQTIVCKIFELGLTRFNTCSDYILSYINFMTSLNEGNNTRVLFERVLTTCCLEPKDSIEIWNSFLEFEAGVGDLSSITKVERRRIAALEKIFPKSTETSWAIDKYKFQDLFPCTTSELRSLGYDTQQCQTSLASVRQYLNNLNTISHPHLNQHIPTSSGSSNKRSKKSHGHRLSNGGALGDSNETSDFPLDYLNQTTMCQPDLEQMLPFKPVMMQGFGAHTVPGGIFQPPPAVGNLLTRIPQSGIFWGPFVDVEELTNIIKMTNFDDLFNNLVENRREMSKSRPKKSRVE